MPTCDVRHFVFTLHYRAKAVRVDIKTIDWAPFCKKVVLFAVAGRTHKFFSSLLRSRIIRMEISDPSFVAESTSSRAKPRTSHERKSVICYISRSYSITLNFQQRVRVHGSAWQFYVTRFLSKDGKSSSPVETDINVLNLWPLQLISRRHVTYVPRYRAWHHFLYLSGKLLIRCVVHWQVTNWVVYLTPYRGWVYTASGKLATKSKV